MNRLTAILFFSCISNLLWAQMDNHTGRACAMGKQHLSDKVLKAKSQRYPGDAEIDVHYYFLDIEIDPVQKHLQGQVQIGFEIEVEGKSSFDLDLIDTYSVDSVWLNERHAEFTHSADQIHIELGEVPTKGTKLQAIVFYHGFPPQNTGRISIVFDQNQYGDSVIWTLSEPYDAPTWWPCVDNQADKADSCDVWITLPPRFTAVSQGLLQELKLNDDGTHTAKWRHRYPIAHYLISIAASNYTYLERHYLGSTQDSMLVADYVYPGIANSANLKTTLDLTPQFLSLFSSVYGEYPFIKEKYGHAMFGFGGGMEHQTVSSMGQFSFGLIAHELAHQWFGDKVTCKTWRDIWVNEGFAEFSALYANEQFYGKDTYNRLIASYMQDAKLVDGSIAIENPSSVSSIFDYRKTYQKGSVVVHMLRGILGEELFFQVLKEYQNTEFAYGAASIDDFQAVAERVYGQSLQWFFDEWLFGKGYPKYTISWNQVNEHLYLNVLQEGSDSATPYFVMPVELELTYADGTHETRGILVNEKESQFELNVSSDLRSLAFDPNNWIMKDLTDKSGMHEVLGIYEPTSPITVYPNPSDKLIRIEWDTKEPIESLKILDLAGKVWCRSKQAKKEINIEHLPAGRYFIQLQSEQKVFVKSFVKY